MIPPCPPKGGNGATVIYFGKVLFSVEKMQNCILRKAPLGVGVMPPAPLKGGMEQQ